MKRYPKYKDSGIEWIGEIPEHWEVKKLKYFSKIVNGSTPKSGKSEYWGGEIVWVTPNDLGKLNGNLITDSLKKITQLGLNSCGTTLTPKNSIILSTRAPIGHIGITDIRTCTNQGCKTIVHDSSKCENKFLFYYLFSSKNTLQSLGQGSTFIELSSQNLKDFQNPVPLLHEQQIIANYLDHKTHLVDTLIEKKQKLIDLLKEQRTAIINQAVTKGLNPDVKLKDSGIEWLGEIPEHWEVKKGKYLFSIVNGHPPEQINFAEDGQHTYFRVDDLNEDGHGLYLTNGKAKFILGSTALYQKNLILFPKRGVAILTNKVKITAIQNLFDTNLMGLNVFRNNADTEFLSYCLLTRRLNDIADTSTIPQINNKHIYPLFFPLPPLIEQKSISNFLNQYIHKTDSLILKIEKTIDHLKEYRTALISEVVTGKIDVRDSEIQEVIHT